MAVATRRNQNNIVDIFIYIITKSFVFSKWMRIDPISQKYVPGASMYCKLAWFMVWVGTEKAASHYLNQ